MDWKAILFVVPVVAAHALAMGGVRTSWIDLKDPATYPLYQLPAPLPQADVYGTDAPRYPGDVASSLCLDCHSASPVRNANPDESLFPSDYPAKAVRSGTHFVAHSWNGLKSGVRPSHFAEALRPELVDPWPGGGSSKYASPAPPAETTQSVTGAKGEMICESCHSLVLNVAGGNNLLEAYLPDADDSTLCEGCHTAEKAGLPPHHPLDLSAPRTVGTPPAQSEVTLPTTTTKVNCASCHKPHGAQSQAGARCLKRGYSLAPSIAGRPVNVNYVTGLIDVTCTADVVPGIDRQWDVGTDAEHLMPRLVTNYDPLCESCHQ